MDQNGVADTFWSIPSDDVGTFQGDYQFFQKDFLADQLTGELGKQVAKALSLGACILFLRGGFLAGGHRLLSGNAEVLLHFLLDAFKIQFSAHFFQFVQLVLQAPVQVFLLLVQRIQTAVQPAALLEVCLCLLRGYGAAFAVAENIPQEIVDIFRHVG